MLPATMKQTEDLNEPTTNGINSNSGCIVNNNTEASNNLQHCQITLKTSEFKGETAEAKFRHNPFPSAYTDTRMKCSSNPPWWNRRTRLERILCVFVLLSLIVSLSLVSLLAAIGSGQLNSLDEELPKLSVKANRLLFVRYNPNNGLDYYDDSPPETHLHSFPLTKVTNNLKSILPAELANSPYAGPSSEPLPHILVESLNPTKLSPNARRAKQVRGFNQQEDNEIQQQQVCLTPGCVKAAADILKNIDERVDPCDDFYKYSCGNWIESQVIPEDKTSVSLFSLVQDELDNKLRNLIEKPQVPAIHSEPPIVGKMRNLYESCMNTTHIEELNNEPLLKVIRQLGGWPVLGKKSGWMQTGTQEKPFDWLELLIKFRKSGFDHDILIDLSVTPDFRNNTQHIIDLDQVSLGMPDRSYLLKGLNDSSVSAYYNLMVESAIMLGAERRDAELQMLDALNFETQLANFSLAREERRNISSLYNKMKISQLSAIAPNINWNKYLVNLLDDPLDGDEEVIVNVPTYFTKLDKILVEVNPKTLANYMMWRVVLQSVSTLGKKWRELAQSYNAAITGQEREEPRWEQCLSSLTGTLGIAISSMYVKHYFKSESKGLAMEMVGYIKNEFTNILDKIDWMDEATRQEAREKANAITSYIGYPDELLNDTLIEELYSGLDLRKGRYFDNILHLRKWSTDYSFSHLRKPNLKVDWRKHARAATVNAFYNSLDNSIEFPAGILQGAFFDRAKPNYLNFGAIGFVIGHEITHGFDDRGRQFDKDGNNRNWWNTETDLRFKERAQCIIDQYSNYTVPENGLKVNGVNTQGENIADNGGLKEAFNAYNEWVKRNGVEPTLPGIKLNQKQLFWVSAANVWCGKYRPEVLKMRVMVGSHSPAQFRITGPLSNLKEFSETFNCPVGAPLNPVKKCSVW